MKLEVRQVILKDPIDDIETHQWQAIVSINGRKVYRSCGYHYACEARKAGEFWISLQEGK